MKIRNKKTGEIATLTLSTNGEDMIIMGNDMLAHITKLSELKDYEDYEEPKEHYFITEYGEVFSLNEYEGMNNVANPEDYKSIGNYFETREEAEKAVEKLKAWKRLRDKGFSFEGYDDGYKHDFNSGHIEFYVENDGGVLKDLDLLFGGEE